MTQDFGFYEKRGYLQEDFRLFRLKDTSMERIDWHFHDFHKLILLLNGRSAYGIEGKHYAMLPGDLVLVPQGCIHRPESDGLYERIILYLSPAYLSRLGSAQWDLSGCFGEAKAHGQYLLRPRDGEYRRLLTALANAGEGFAAPLLRESLLTQLMISLCRDVDLLGVEAACDPKIVAILCYLNENLASPISIDDLSKTFFMSKYHMMRRFRGETGFTVHGYLTEKRLQRAMQLLLEGQSAQAACIGCGFQDYSAFSRAFQKRYGKTPGRVGTD